MLTEWDSIDESEINITNEDVFALTNLLLPHLNSLSILAKTIFEKCIITFKTHATQIFCQ
jgi:hypothetical protein